MKSHLLACALGLFLTAISGTSRCSAVDGEGKAETAKASDGGNENLIGKLKGFVVSATVKQAIGNFNSYSSIRIGDSFELDLDNLPVKRIELIPVQPGKETHIVPLRAPLQIQEASRWSGGKTCAIKITEAATANPPHDCRILIVAQSLEKGSPVRVTIYVSGGGFIGSMAEAEGVLK